jgi:hypothetical protein
MSEPKRLTFTSREVGGGETSKTEWVSLADYAKLKAEVERLRASSFVTAVPVEQYERVIKAGDACADALNLNDDVFDNKEKREAQANWLAAKEGKQP